ncbi:MAG: hypothetical protein AB2660_20955 [Candidatus Thiodiazotropha sp.]|nr:hypothetical protein [Candidatus Thiodiazotropha sp. (ex Codakia orbicularis)]
MRKILCLTLIVITTLGHCGCSNFLYVVRAANYGEYGVILKQMDTTMSYSRIHPGIPGVRDDIAVMNRFVGYAKTLPDKVEIEWQLAELSDCKRIIKHKSFVHKTKDEKIYTRKAGCTWSPLENKVYRKVIDLTEVRQSEDAKMASKTIRIGSKRSLSIFFVFRDDDLTLSFGSRRTNAFK